MTTERGMSEWGIHENGMISQSLADMMDTSVQVFTETARDHNQAIQDAKEVTA
uniref:hypothetical protein n=1 Tax=Arthrobacter silvisoli TaxID=2291022 RepID=UPI003F4937B5